MRKTNEAYMIEVGAPLLRPGMKVIVGPVSKRYVASTMSDLMEIIREFNEKEKKRAEEKEDSAGS